MLIKKQSIFLLVKNSNVFIMPKEPKKIPFIGLIYSSKKGGTNSVATAKKKYLSSCRFSLSFLVLFNFTFPLIKVRLLNLCLLKIMI